MTTALFIHYSKSPDVPAEEIDDWHRARGFPPEGHNPLKYIGYHWVVHPFGMIEAGRSDDVRPMHCPGWNKLGVIAVCCTGSDSLPWYPTDFQYKAVASLIEKYQPQQVWMHKEQYSTSCPGRFNKPYCLSLVGRKKEESDMKFDFVESKKAILGKKEQLVRVYGCLIDKENATLYFDCDIPPDTPFGVYHKPFSGDILHAEYVGGGYSNGDGTHGAKIPLAQLFGLGDKIVPAGWTYVHVPAGLSAEVIGGCY